MLDFTSHRPEAQLRIFMKENGFDPPLIFKFDGKFHRFGEGKKGQEKDWYVGEYTSGGHIRCTFGSHVKDVKHNYFSRQSQSSGWKKGTTLLEKLENTTSQINSAYLLKKKIPSLFGARMSPFTQVVVPVYMDLELTGLQTINEDGTKKFVSGTKKASGYFELNGLNLENENRIFIAEGFATAASVFMAMKSRTICAFDAGNIGPVFKKIHEKYPTAEIIIAGDDDQYSAKNAGRNAALSVASKSRSVFPLFSDLSTKPTDWNDLHVLLGINEVRRQIEEQLTTPVKLPEPNEAKIEFQEPIPISQSEKSQPEKSFFSGKELFKIDLPLPKDQVIPGLRKGKVGVLAALGGDGKSGLSILIASQIAMGGQKDFVGFGHVYGGMTCIVTLEDDPQDYAVRVQNIGKDFSEAEKNAFYENFVLLNSSEQECEISHLSVINSIKKGFLEKGSDLKNLRLIIIDHLSLWGDTLDVSKSKDATQIMKSFYKIARTLNCAVLVVHHLNRSAHYKGKDSVPIETTISGSHKIVSHSRFTAVIRSPSQEELQKYFGRSTPKDDERIFEAVKVNFCKKYTIPLSKRDERLGILYKTDFVQNPYATNGQTVYREKDGSDDSDHLYEDDLFYEELNEEERLQKEDEKLTEQAKNYSLVEASPKLATLKENELHAMNWSVRNPVFITTSKIDRAALTILKDGKESDVDRAEPDYHLSVWGKGDCLRVLGPICDHEDGFLYFSLLMMLTERHKKGEKGLTLITSFSEIMDRQKLDHCGQNLITLKRRLDRLNRMNLSFSNVRGLRWQGPLISGFHIRDNSFDHKVMITFNKYMIIFYNLQEYTCLKKDMYWSLSGNAKALFTFYSSHKAPNLTLTIEKIGEILGIKPKVGRKDLVRRITTAIESLIEVGFLDKEKSCVKDGLVYSWVIRGKKGPLSVHIEDD